VLQLQSNKFAFKAPITSHKVLPIGNTIYSPAYGSQAFITFLQIASKQNTS